MALSKTRFETVRDWYYKEAMNLPESTVSFFANGKPVLLLSRSFNGTMSLWAIVNGEESRQRFLTLGALVEWLDTRV